MHSKKTQKNESTETEDDHLVYNTSMLISIDEAGDLTNDAVFHCDDNSTEEHSNQSGVDTGITYETQESGIYFNQEK